MEERFSTDCTVVAARNVPILLWANGFDVALYSLGLIRNGNYWAIIGLFMALIVGIVNCLLVIPARFIRFMVRFCLKCFRKTNEVCQTPKS